MYIILLKQNKKTHSVTAQKRTLQKVSTAGSMRAFLSNFYLGLD